MPAKKKVPAGKAKRDDVAVKIDRKIISDAKIVVARSGQSLAEYLSDLLRAPICRDAERTIKERAAEGRD